MDVPRAGSDLDRPLWKHPRTQYNVCPSSKDELSVGLRGRPAATDLPTHRTPSVGQILELLLVWPIGRDRGAIG